MKCNEQEMHRIIRTGNTSYHYEAIYLSIYMNTAREDMHTGIFAGLLDFDNEGCLSIILLLLQRELVNPTSLINYSGTIQIIVCCYFNIIVHINNIVSWESDLIYLHTATLSCFGILEVQADWPFYE